jgi:hypothetical protein
MGAVRKKGKLASIRKCRSVLHGTLRGERKQNELYHPLVMTQNVF